MEHGTADDLVVGVLRGLSPRILDRSPVEYRCYCSRERVAAALETVGSEALEEMAESGEDTEVSCHFCDKVYHFSPEEIRGFSSKTDEKNE